MALDPLVASMSDTGRELLARIGRRYGTREVLAQARLTLAALERHAEQLRLHGFGHDHAKLLAAAHRAAAARVRARQKATDGAYLLALEQSKHGRTRARSVLLSSYRRLRMTGGPGAAELMDAIEIALTQTGGPGGDDRVYAAEIELLLTCLREPALAALLVDAGGPEAVAKLEAALACLRELDAQALDPDALEADALDGMIVELARTAHFAAKAAAQELGERAIAKEFRLRLRG